MNSDPKENKAKGIVTIIFVVILFAVGKSVMNAIFPQYDDTKIAACKSLETIQSIGYYGDKFIAKTDGGSVFEIDNTKYKEGDLYCVGRYFTDKTNKDAILDYYTK